MGRKGGGFVCVCATRYGFDPSLSELTGLVVRGVKLRIFMFKAGLWLAGLNMRNFNRQPSNLIIPS